MRIARAAGILTGVVADGVVATNKGRTAAVVAGAAGAWLGRRHPWLRMVSTAMATWGALGAKRLTISGAEIAKSLENGQLNDANETLFQLDYRRDTNHTVHGIARASVETIAQTTSESIVAPLFWGAVAGPSGILGSQLVAALGRQGTNSYARLHRLVNLVPSQLTAAMTVMAAPVVGGSADESRQAWLRDITAHPQPNNGRVQAAFAGALQIRVGGRTSYVDGVKELPVLGEGRNPDAGHVTRAVELSRLVGWLTGVSLAALTVFGGPTRKPSRAGRGRGHGPAHGHRAVRR